MGLIDPLYGAEQPVILGAERPATWGGTTHDVGRITIHKIPKIQWGRGLNRLTSPLGTSVVEKGKERMGGNVGKEVNAGKKKK